MSGIHLTTFESIRFGSYHPLKETQLKDLVRLFDQPTPAAGSVLGGRTSAVRHSLAGVGPVVIKFFRRGGLISRFNEKTYLRYGKTRGQREYEMMEEVRRIGVRAPQPVAFAYRGLLFYHCWLVTGEIEKHQTLAALSRNDPKQAVLLSNAVAVEINRLIRHNIHHVDLHPGNVLIDPQQRVFLIDFDKARRTQLGTAELRNRYLRRWQRAVSKHQLPTDMSAALKKALFQNPSR